jgi:hypothetical protein
MALFSRIGAEDAVASRAIEFSADGCELHWLDSRGRDTAAVVAPSHVLAPAVGTANATFCSLYDAWTDTWPGSSTRTDDETMGVFILVVALLLDHAAALLRTCVKCLAPLARSPPSCQAQKRSTSRRPQFLGGQGAICIYVSRLEPLFHSRHVLVFAYRAVVVSVRSRKLFGTQFASQLTLA